MKLKERVCKKCKGNGIEVKYDEYIGRSENLCPVCHGEGTIIEGLVGYQVYRMIPEKFLILDKGDIAYLYIKKMDGIYHWATWSVGLVVKQEEEYEEHFENVDELQELEEDQKLVISLFYMSDDEAMYWEGKSYSSRFQEGFCFCGEESTNNSEFCKNHLEEYEEKAFR